MSPQLSSTEIMIRLLWEGPFLLTPDIGFDDPNKDFGVYQICGNHSELKPDSLLYIGLAGERAEPKTLTTMGNRLRQHVEYYKSSKPKFYVGRLTGETMPDDDTWAQHIRLAETMLIFWNQPTDNTANTVGMFADSEHGKILGSQRVRVQNYGDFGLLVPECSSDYMSDHATQKKGYLDVYSYERREQ